MVCVRYRVTTPSPTVTEAAGVGTENRQKTQDCDGSKLFDLSFSRLGVVAVATMELTEVKCENCGTTQQITAEKDPTCESCGSRNLTQVQAV